jgi:hypothetical protein
VPLPRRVSRETADTLRPAVRARAYRSGVVTL